MAIVALVSAVAVPVSAVAASGGPDPSSGSSPSLSEQRNDHASQKEIEKSRDAYDGDVSASQTRDIVGDEAPSLVAPDTIVPPAEDVAHPLAPTALQMRGKDGQPGGVMQSNLPVAVQTPTTDGHPHGLELANIDWRHDGDRIEIKRPVIPVSLPSEADGTLRFGDLGARLAPGAEDTTASVTGETVTYPNVETDRDLVVRSTTVGVEALWTLRSPDADRVIKVPVDVPDGGKLVRLTTGEVDIQDADGRSVGSMGSTTAVDADHKDVPVDVDVDGDTVVITVKPDVAETQWPIVVDPIFTARWDAGSSTNNADLANWETKQNRPNPFYLTRQNGSPTNGTFGGLLLSGVAGAAGSASNQYTTNDYGVFRRYAPGNTSIGATSNQHAWWYRFDVGDLTYNNDGGAYSFDPEGAIRLQTNPGPVQSTTYQYQNPDANASTNYSSPSYDSTKHNAEFKGFPNGTKVGAAIYSGSDMYDSGIGPGNPTAEKAYDNFASVSLIDYGTWGQNRRPNTQMLMGWYRLYAADNVAPVLGSGGSRGSKSWTNSPPTSIAGPTPTDNGTGVELVGLTNAVVPNPTWASKNVATCPMSGRMECPFTYASPNLALGTLPEGRTTYKLLAIDAGGQVSAPQDVDFAVDTSSPTIALSNSLYTNRDAVIRGGLTRPLTVTATDGNASGGPSAQRSGVKNIKIFVDDNQVYTKNQDDNAPVDSASLAGTWTPAPGAFSFGTHHIRVEATDNVGNPVAKQEFDIKGGCCGTTAGQRPDDTLISDSLNQRTSYGVSAVTGNLLVNSGDVSIAGVGSGLKLTRYYNSVHNGLKGLNGDGFTDALTSDVRIFTIDGSDDVSVRFGDGQVYRYTNKQSDGTFKRPTSIDSDGQTKSNQIEADLSQDTGNGTYTLSYPRSQTKWNFRSDGKLAKLTDRNGNTTTLTYGTGGDLNTITDPNGRDLTVSVVGDRLKTLTDASGRQWKYAYGGTDADGHTNTDAGFLTSYTDPSNGVTKYGYDTQGRMDRVDSPGGATLSVTYTGSTGQDRVHTLTRATTSGPAQVWTFDFDSDDPDPKQCSSDQKKTLVTDPRGLKTAYCIDSGRLKLQHVTNAKGDNTHDVNYTSLGQVKSFTDNTDATSSNQIDPTTNNVQKSTGAEGETSTASYNDFKYKQQATQTTDADQHSRFFDFDADTGRVTGIRQNPASTSDDPNQMSAALAYNDDGTIKSAKDARGKTTTYTYWDGTKKGLLKTYNPPGPLNATSFDYDTVGRVSSITDGRNKTTTYSYDELDQIKKVTFDGGSTETNTYDSDGNLTDRNDSVSGDYQYKYDKLNKRVKDTLPDGRTIAYTYDPDGNLSTYTDGTGTTSYGYNDLNQNCFVAPQSSASATQSCTGTLPANYIGLEYDTHGYPKVRHYPNGVDVTTVYDKSGKVRSVRAKKGTTSLATRIYTYADGRTQLQSLDKGSQGTISYTYDGIGQLKTATGGAPRSGTAGDLSYTYDLAGNRKTTTCTVGSTTSTVTMSYNDANQLTDESKTGTICGLANPSNSFTYDGAGNDTRFTYNDRNQTTNMAGHDLTYGGLGQNELVKDDTATLENNILGVSRKIVGSSATSYIRGINGEIYGRRTSGGTYTYYVQDALGSVITILNDDGTTNTRYDYDPDGNTTAKPDDFGYTGSFVSGSATSWRYHNGARWYDPQTARWTQGDELDNPRDLRQANRYAYSANDPVNNVDQAGKNVNDCPPAKQTAGACNGTKTGSPQYGYGYAGGYGPGTPQYIAGQEEAENTLGAVVSFLGGCATGAYQGAEYATLAGSPEAGAAVGCLLNGGAGVAGFDLVEPSNTQDAVGYKP